jgi:hypothetical protein
MATFLPNGLGGFTVGDSLAQAESLQVSGNVWYVDTADGTDAVSPAGLNATAPLQSLSQAITNAADHDIIVMLQNNGAGLTGALTISKSVTIIGAGSSAGRPANSLYRTGGANVSLLTISASNVQLRNLYFPATDTSSVSAYRINVGNSNFRMVGCYVECGPYDAGPALGFQIASDRAEIRNCTFVSTSLTNPPESAIKSPAQNGMRIFSTTIDGGRVGFSNYYAVQLLGAITRLEVENLSLLNGADMSVHSGSVGWVNVERATGSSRVDW